MSVMPAGARATGMKAARIAPSKPASAISISISTSTSASGADGSQSQPIAFSSKGVPVRVKKTRQNKRLEPGSDSIRTEKALGHDLYLHDNPPRRDLLAFGNI